MTTKPNRSLEKLQAQAEDGNLYAQCRLADVYLAQETKEGNRAALLWLRGFV